METLAQDNGTGNARAFHVGYAVCMRHTNSQLIALSFADSEEIAEQAVAKLLYYHDQEPQLGVSDEISIDEAFRLREDLRNWCLRHRVGENRSYDVEGFEVLMLPVLDRAALASLVESSVPPS